MDDMPDINFVTQDVPASELITSEAEAIGPEMIKALLVRTFAHDVTSCDETKELLTAIGLTHGDDEGYEIDHVASHRRMHMVFPLEALLRLYAELMGTVVATALAEGHGVTQDMTEDQSILFAEQNAKVVLASSRAIIAQLISKGVLVYGPASIYLQAGVVGG